MKNRLNYLIAIKIPELELNLQDIIFCIEFAKW